MNTNDTTKSEVALREEEVLAFWRERDIFNKSVEKDAPNGDFVFYDGPPFATGLPHYGHILAGTIKDAVPRFWTMNGYRVRRKWGWDCHGLPLENLIEKKLGLATKRDIEEYGVQNFNEAAREAVMEYADDWKRIIPRMGRWADMDDDYKTMDPSYTESVWWVFAELHKKNLVYEGFKTMHLCPRCGTTLSNFEVNQGYKDIKDIAVTVKLPLLDEHGAITDTSLLVWTTTPWTLPGNMAAAVHKDVEYVKVSLQHIDQGIALAESSEQLPRVNLYEEYVILAKERLQQLGTEDYKVLETFNGSTLVGKSYQPPFEYWNGQQVDGSEHAWKIYHADYVEIGAEGTGAVHLAPAYGEEDMELAREHGIPIVHHVDTDGHFMDFVTDFAGQLVKPKDDDDAGILHLDADIEVVKKLKENGKLFRKENITHSYPHCWRCDTPLLNYATTSWFVRVTDIKDTLVAENNKVTWVPEHVGTNRFGKWLEGARDWAVSRQRYWGAPLPIWRNDVTKEYKVFASLKELQTHVPVSHNTYYMLRHAEAKSNVSGVINALPDETNTLTEIGVAQCETVAKNLKEKKIDIIIHSGMERAKATALAIARSLGLDESHVIADERITELQVGTALEGKQWSAYEALFDTYEEKFTKRIDGVENRFDVQRRVGEFLYELEETYQEKQILIVGHASSLFALQTVAEGGNMERAIEIREQGYLKNAELKELPFTPMPHNDTYELDYHRPYIDAIQLVDTDGTPLTRVPDVFDCWFESGSMPYAETHYPFENLEESNPAKGIRFPADFISESVDQTRGWFYSLMVLGTALFDVAPFKHVITNGLVLAEDGKKMSKKLQNYPDPSELVDRQGADAMRYYLLSSPIIRGEDLNFSEKEVQELQRKNIGRLHNVLQMYEQNSDATVQADATSTHVLDQWICARLNQLILDTTSGFRSYELDKATRPITEFIDDLSVWYIRRSRDRFKSDDTTDREASVRTLRFVLKTLACVMAPSMPFYADYLWTRVRGETDVESVHLAKWPEADEINHAVLTNMQDARDIVSSALEARTEAGIKVRQPLLRVRIRHELNAEFAPYSELIRDEVNVKEVVSDMSLTTEVALDTTITPQLQAEGDAREFIRSIQALRKEQGLRASDKITLAVQTSDSGEALVRMFEHGIARTVGATEIVFKDAHGTEVVAGDHSFTVELHVH